MIGRLTDFLKYDSVMLLSFFFRLIKCIYCFEIEEDTDAHDDKTTYSTEQIPVQFKDDSSGDYQHDPDYYLKFLHDLSNVSFENSTIKTYAVIMSTSEVMVQCCSNE